jgi:hypothetical protein
MIWSKASRIAMLFVLMWGWVDALAVSLLNGDSSAVVVVDDNDHYLRSSKESQNVCKSWSAEAFLFQPIVDPASANVYCSNLALSAWAILPLLSSTDPLHAFMSMQL